MGPKYVTGFNFAVMPIFICILPLGYLKGYLLVLILKMLWQVQKELGNGGLGAQKEISGPKVVYL